MTHRTTPTHTNRRSLSLLAAAASVALLGAIGTACMDVGSVEDDNGELLSAVNCSGLRTWTATVDDSKPGSPPASYKVNEQVQLKGTAFRAFISYTAFDPNWQPGIAPSLWQPIGTCQNGAPPPPVVTPPPPPPPTQQPPTQQPPPVVNNPPPDTGGFDAFKCLAATGTNGGKFDDAGDFENVGNGAAKQFITGRCLSNADCGSGCCAKPCGICSGPAVGAAAGKTGCGFDIRNPFAK